MAQHDQCLLAECTGGGGAQGRHLIEMLFLLLRVLLPCYGGHYLFEISEDYSPKKVDVFSIPPSACENLWNITPRAPVPLISPWFTKGNNRHVTTSHRFQIILKSLQHLGHSWLPGNLTEVLPSTFIPKNEAVTLNHGHTGPRNALLWSRIAWRKQKEQNYKCLFLWSVHFTSERPYYYCWEQFLESLAPKRMVT